jgi:hypothetical protein
MKPGDLVRIRPGSPATDGNGPAEDNGEFGVFVNLHAGRQFDPVARVLNDGRLLYILQRNLEIVDATR